jgi:hypothetical protein
MLVGEAVVLAHTRNVSAELGSISCALYKIKQVFRLGYDLYLKRYYSEQSISRAEQEAKYCLIILRIVKDTQFLETGSEREAPHLSTLRKRGKAQGYRNHGFTAKAIRWM